MALSVTYTQALETMTQHGDSVLDYLEACYRPYGAFPDTSGRPWSGTAVQFLSMAVELWVSGIDLDDIAGYNDDDEDEDYGGGDYDEE